MKIKKMCAIHKILLLYVTSGIVLLENDYIYTIDLSHDFVCAHKNVKVQLPQN